MNNSGSIQGVMVITLFCAAAIVLQVILIGWNATTPIVLTLLILALFFIYVVPLAHDVLCHGQVLPDI